MSSLRKQLQKAKLPPILPSLGTRGGRKVFGRSRDYTPESWDKYFDEHLDIHLSETDVFRVYKSGSTGPYIVLLHGGGYSALTWATLSASLIKLVECQVIAIDLRGHGCTMTADDSNLSADVLANDVGAVVNKICDNGEQSVILIGHSMGGAIAVHAASKNIINSLIGLVVIDVVEGTAMDALISMQSFLRSRPNTFSSIETAIEWCIRSGQVKNLESAKVSMPGQIKNLTTGQLAINDINNSIANVGSHETTTYNVTRGNSIVEENESDEGDEESQSPKKTKCEDGHFKVPQLPGALHETNSKYSWRIDLAQTEKYWEGWFKGLSNMFLNCNPAKMLLLAGVDRLDKELTIGQMQGKFQMQVLPQCGHAVHEDVPEKVADALASFMVRNKFVQPKDNYQVVLPGC